MDTTTPQQPEPAENDSSMLPKLEDLVAVTGLFTPGMIIEELQDLEQLDKQQDPVAESDKTKGE